MPKVVMIDDEDTILNLMQSVFERFEIDYLFFESAEDFLENMDSIIDDVFLIITDILLPGITGAELTSLIKASYPDIPIYGISGYADDIIPVRNYGIDKFYNKPFDIIKFSDDILELKKKSEGH